MTASDPDEVRARWLELQAAEAVRALRTDREAAVTEFVWMEEYSEDHRPAPYWQQQLGRTPGRRLDGPRDDATRVGLDGAGRPVLAERITGGKAWRRDLLTWSHDRVELVGVRGERARELCVLWLDGDRPVEQISCDGNPRPDGRPAVEVVRYDYDHAGRLVLAPRVWESGSESWGSTATRFTHDATGALVLVEHLVGPQEIARGQGHDAALAAPRAGLDESAPPGHIVWDGRIAAREDDLPEPEHAFDGVAIPLADAVHRAVARVRDRVGRLAFVVVDLSSEPPAGRLSLLGAAAAGVDHRDRARHLVDDIQDVLALAYAGSEHTAELDVLDAATPDLQRRLRAGVQSLEGQWEVQTRVTLALATELARELDKREWPDADPGFLALVRTNDEAERNAGIEAELFWDDDEEDLDPARRPLPGKIRFDATRTAVGDERVDALMSALTPPGKHPIVAAGADVRVPDRPALAALLEQAGLSHAGAERVADDAAWGISLEPAAHAATRLGGLPVLPSEVAWPMAGDRPLTHLATIALSELPSVEGREVLPPDGHLSLFADLSEAGQFYEPLEPDAPGRECIAVIYAPAGVPTHEPSPPDVGARDEYDPPIVLRERRVQPTARLQLREVGFGGAAGRFGIDAVGEHVFGRLTPAINGRIGHQLLGFPPVVQDDPREDGQVALFHLAHDAELGFDFLDAGDLLFFGAPDDIRARRWDRLTAWPSSC